MRELLDQIIPIISTGLLAAIGYLIRSYFASFQKQIDDLKAGIIRRDGKLDALLSKIDENTEARYQMKAEMKALWRTVEHAPRASDIGVRKNG